MLHLGGAAVQFVVSVMASTGSSRSWTTRRMAYPAEITAGTWCVPCNGWGCDVPPCSALGRTEPFGGSLPSYYYTCYTYYYTCYDACPRRLSQLLVRAPRCELLCMCAHCMLRVWSVEGGRGRTRAPHLSL